MLVRTILSVFAILLIPACSPATSGGSSGGEATAEAAGGGGSCANRECGVDPVTKQDCGSCDTAGKMACNDGVCEATCDPQRCGKMSYTQNGCKPRKPCQERADGGITKVAYSCSDDGKTCEMEPSGEPCEKVATKCTACDLNGKGDGLCFEAECYAKEDVKLACKAKVEE